MSIPTKNAKTRLEQKLTNVYTRNNNGTVTTKTDVVDYQTKHPYTLYSYTKTNVIPNTSVHQPHKHKIKKFIELYRAKQS